MFGSRRKLESTIKELEKEIELVKHDLDQAIKMYEMATKEELNSPEEIKAGMTIMFYDDFKSYKIVEDVPYKYFLFGIRKDNTLSSSSRYVDKSYSQKELYYEIKKEYHKVMTP